jgi:hypothetical protein
MAGGLAGGIAIRRYPVESVAASDRLEADSPGRYALTCSLAACACLVTVTASHRRCLPDSPSQWRNCCANQCLSATAARVQNPHGLRAPVWGGWSVLYCFQVPTIVGFIEPCSGLCRKTIAMPRTPKPIRALIVALLAVSTSMAAVCTPVSAMAPQSAISLVESSRPTCCCGTEDAKCCGTACCMQPAGQVPNNPPVRARTDKENSQVLTLLMATCGVALAVGNDFAKAAQSDFCGSLTAPTLQSQHVRIQT